MDKVPWVMLSLHTAPKTDNTSLAKLALCHVPLLPGKLICPTPCPANSTSLLPSMATVPALLSADYAFVRVKAYCSPLQPS